MSAGECGFTRLERITTISHYWNWDHAGNVPGGTVGLFHFCFDVADETALVELYNRCKKAGVELLGTVDHKVMHSFYLKDPDGNMVEIGVDLPSEEWSSVPDPWAEDSPYALRY